MDAVTNNISTARTFNARTLTLAIHALLCVLRVLCRTYRLILIMPTYFLLAT